MTVLGSRLRRTATRLLLASALATLAIVPVGGAASAQPAAPGAGAGTGAGGDVGMFLTDIYMRDNVSDTGIEPSASPFWDSPDIKVCPTPILCTGTPSLPAGSTAYVFVTLRNPGPYGTGTGSGSIRLYYSTTGAATWPTGWSSVGWISVTVPAGATTAMVVWSGLPGPGLVCTLAYWISADDPILVNTSSPQVNTQYNNNVAWKNFSVI